MRPAALLFVVITLWRPTLGHAAAACCGAGGPFAETFSELVKEDFLLPAAPAEKPVAYVITADGERRAIDSRVWTAARRMAARFDQVPEAPVTGPRGWREWTSHLKRRGRVMTLEVIANFVDSFLRFGAPAAALVLSAETIEHTVLPMSLPLCKFVQGACIWVARETQELRHALFNKFPGAPTVRDRVVLLRAARKLRRERKQALRDVMHAADGRDVIVAREDFAPGARVLADSCFRSALATPDPSGHVCVEDHGAGLRYRLKRGPAAAPRLRAESLDRPDPDLIGDDFIEDPVERGWAAADVIGFMNLKLNLARAAVGQFAESDARSFFRLRVRLNAMHKALDLYAYTLSLRAALGRARSADEAELDRRFDQSLTAYLIDFDRAIQLARAGLGREKHPFDIFKTAPRQAIQLIKAWLARPLAAAGSVDCVEDLSLRSKAAL